MTVSDTVAEGTEVTPGNFTTSFTLDYAKTTNTDYISLTGLSCSSEDVPVSTANCNFWGAADGYFWAYATQPTEVLEGGTGTSHGAPIWHFWGTGSDYKLQRIGGTNTASTDYSVTLGLCGPIRYKINAARFGPDSDFALRGTPLFEVGVAQWTSETETEYVQLSPGTLSDWYVQCRIYATGNIHNGLRTGMYDWDATNAVYCKADADWLIAIGDSLSESITEGSDPPITLATCSNQYGAVLIPSTTSQLDTQDPFWGPAIVYAWEEASADIPPGETERPTLWVALANTTVDGTDNGKWTVGAPGDPTCTITNLTGGSTVSRPLEIQVDYEHVPDSTYGLGIQFGAHDVFIDDYFFLPIETGSGSLTVTIDLVDINNGQPVADGTYNLLFALSDGSTVVWADNANGSTPMSLTLAGGSASGWSYTLTEDPEDTNTGGVTRTLASRKPLRLAHMGEGDGTDVNEDWPLINRANFPTPADTAAIISAVPVEDVRDYDNSRMLELTFTTYPATVDWTKVRLTLGYSIFAYTDPCYTPASYGDTYRFGANSDWADNYSRTQYTQVFYATANTVGDGCLFDLWQLSRAGNVNLQHVDTVQISGLSEGEYVLSDLRLVQDPDSHGGTYPHWAAQQCTDPWNYMTCQTGFASVFEGMPHLALDNGTYGSRLSGDVQRGIAQTQYQEYNPEWLAAQESAPEPTDPTYAVPFYRSPGVSRLVAILSMQEQLHGTALDVDTIIENIGDTNGNQLGDMFDWDLQRGTGDEGGGLCCLRVGAVENYPLSNIPQTYILEWSSEGRAHGCAHTGTGPTWRPKRGGGGCDDSGGGYRVKVYRQPVDENGTPTGDWALCGSCDPDITGRYQTPPGLESGYIYQVRSAETVDLGRYVTREYAYADVKTRSLWNPRLRTDKISGVVHLAYIEDDAAVYTQSDTPDLQRVMRWRYGALAGQDGTAQTSTVFSVDNGRWDFPSLTTLPCRSVLYTATDTDRKAVYLKRSNDQGATWASLESVMLSGLEYAAISADDWGIVHCAGYASGNVYYRRSDDGGVNPLTFADGSSSVLVSACEEGQPSITVQPTGEVLIAAPANSGMYTFSSRDGGHTWEPKGVA